MIIFLLKLEKQNILIFLDLRDGLLLKLRNGKSLSYFPNIENVIATNENLSKFTLFFPTDNFASIG